MRTYTTSRVTTVEISPSAKPLPTARRARRTRSTTPTARKSPEPSRGCLDLIPDGRGWCSLDACLPMDVGLALVALFNAHVKAQ